MKPFLSLRPFIVLGIMLFNGITQRVSAQGYEIKNYAVHIDIYQRYFDVKEDITVQFNEPRHGIYRFLPLKYKLTDTVENATIFDQWLGYRIYISHINVPHWPDEVSREDGNVRIKIGDKEKTLTGLQHYTISYRVKNAFLAYKDHSVFYWNLAGSQWDATIDQLTYTISLYKPLALDTSDFSVTTGSEGSTAHAATMDYHNGQFTGGTTLPLNSGEGLTIQLRFPKDYVQPFTSAERIRNWFIWLLLPLSMVFIFIVVWRKIGRDRKLINVVNYLPPKDINPALAGFLMDEHSNDSDLISLLPYWAANGFISMQYRPKDHFWKVDEWTFIKKKDIETTSPNYEQTLFNGLFSSGDEVKLSVLKDTFYKTMEKARKQLSESALKGGFYTPKSVKFFHYSQVLLLVAGIGFVIFLFAMEQIFAAIFTIGVTVLLLVFNHLLLQRSTKGDDAFQQINGFKMFVQKAEKPKLETLLREDPTYFEKTLGYAVAFNLMEKWARHFDGLLQQPPSWYQGYSGSSFQMNTFVSQFNGGLSSMRTVMTSSPSGSSGGSSGGGFGGGGGGSW